MICTQEDAWVLELQHDRATPVWVAQLADGRRAYMDDDRPGVEPPSAWLRLLHSGASLRGLWLKFRSRQEKTLPADADGYFFCKQAVRTDGMDRTLAFYLLGWLEGQTLHVQRYSVPELILVDATRRDPAVWRNLLWTKSL